MRKIILLLSIAAGLTGGNVSHAQCTFTINPGPDITICNPGTTVSLGTTVTGPFLSATWSPSTGLSNPNSPATNATVNATTTYTLTVTGVGSNNLVTNGNFSGGLSGFTSNYVPGTGGAWGLLSAEGTFAIATNPNQTHTAFVNCSDHTGGGGNMLVVNGAGTPNQNVWCQTIPVDQNTMYSFGAWGTSVVSGSPAILQIRINGNLLGTPFTLPNATCQWTQFFALWNSGSASSATICIVNQNTQTGGNDFALDDLFFGPVCEQTAEVTVTIETVNATWTPPQGLCPESPAFDLNSLLTPDATPGGSWTINGVADFFFNPFLLGAGTHSVTYTVGEAPCIQTLTLPIVVNPLPSAAWAPPPALCVSSPDFPLDLLLEPGALPGGSWTINGIGATIFDPITLGPGLHSVIYTTGTPPCTNTLAQVIEVSPLPNVSWTPPALVCEGGSPIELNSLLDPGAVSGGSWTVNGAASATLNPELLPPGPYTVIYSFGAPDCPNSSSQIIDITPRPTANFSIPSSICHSDTVSVVYTGMAAPMAVFNWDFSGATVISGDGQGPYDLFWPVGSGSQTVSLVVTADGCPSLPISQTIQLAAPLPIPNVSCNDTSTELELTWNPLSDGVPLQVTVEDGPAGMSTSDTSYVVGGLQPGQLITVRLSGGASYACDDLLLTLGCDVLPCVALDLALSPVDTVCFPADTIQLQAQIIGAAAPGTLTWSGPGIVNPATGLWVPNNSIAGQSITVYANYVEGPCTANDSLIIPVVRTPVSTFTLTPVICETDSALVEFTGIADSNTVFHWAFNGNPENSNPDSSTFYLTWAQGGNYTVSLSLESGPCRSDTTSRSIQVEESLATPVIQCETTQTSVAFSWINVVNASGYEILAPGGQAFSSLSDTSVIFEGLVPGDMVSVQVRVLSDGACPDAVATATCTASLCPQVTITADEQEIVCWNGSPDTLQMTATVSAANGTLTWTGEGIISGGRWVSAADMTGRIIPVTAVFTSGLCEFTDEILIRVEATPTADIQADSFICENGSTMVAFTGTAGTSASFAWDFGVGEATPGQGPGPQSMTFPSPGQYEISLTVEENGCVSTPGTWMVTVDPLPEVPEITCTATYTGVIFQWSQGDNVMEYIPEVQGNISGSLIADTSFSATGLEPGQTVELMLRAVAEGACPDVLVSATCTTLPCPSVDLNVSPLPQICWDGLADTLQLSAQVIGGPPSGVLRWEGEGVVNTVNGLWVSSAAMVGSTVSVRAIFTDDVCVYADSTTLSINAVPAVAIVGDSLVCVSSPAVVQYAGNAGPGATYSWQFGGGSATTGVGPGPHSVAFPSAGSYFLTLGVEVNGCQGHPDTLRIQADPLLAIPTPECTPGYTSIAFSWPSVSGASDYLVALPPGLMPTWTSDTSISIQGLLPSTSVVLQLEAQSGNACPNTLATISCQTLSCPSVELSLQGPAVVCAGDSARIQFSVNGPVGTSLNLVLSDGVQTWPLNNVQTGSSFAFLPLANAQVSVTSVINPALPFCPVTPPADLAITVEAPREAGMALGRAGICALTDTLIQLSDLLSGEDVGGFWSLGAGSTVPAPGGFFPATGTFRPVLQGAGNYIFQYSLPAGVACPADTSRVEVELFALPVADAGPDRVLDCLNTLVSIGRGGNPALSYQWTTIGGNLLADNMAIVEADAPGRYLLEVIDLVTGCRNTDEMAVISDINLIEPFFNIGQISCYGTDDGFIRLDSISGGVPPLSFSVNGGTFREQSSFTGLGPGIYQIVIRDSEGCQTERRFELLQPVEVQVVLDAVGLAGDFPIIKLGDSLQLRVLTNVPDDEIQSIAWMPDVCENCTEISLLPSYTALYSITLTNTNGCMAEAVLEVGVDRRPDVFVPNVFTPNNDGNNDRLVIFAGKQIAKARKFQVFSRWGEPIFEAFEFPLNNPDFAWDGTHRGSPLNPAVFVFYLQVETIDGVLHEFNGDITLMK